MATATQTPARRASKVGTIDPMDLSKRVYTDDMLQEVSPSSPDAAFVFKRADLAARIERRTELGLDERDEAARVQRESRKVAQASAARRLAEAQALVDSLKDEVARETASRPGGSDSLTPKEKLQAEARDLGLDDSGMVDELKTRIADKRAESGT